MARIPGGIPAGQARRCARGWDSLVASRDRDQQDAVLVAKHLVVVMCSRFAPRHIEPAALVLLDGLAQLVNQLLEQLDPPELQNLRQPRFNRQVKQLLVAAFAQRYLARADRHQTR